MPVQRPGINDPTRQNNYQPFNSQTLQNLVQKLRDAMSNGSMQYGQPNNDQSGFIQPMPLVPGGTPPTGMAPALTGALPNQMPQNNISQAADRTCSHMQANPMHPAPTNSNHSPHDSLWGVGVDRLRELCLVYPQALHQEFQCIQPTS
jgi:hypothetical protein